MIRLLSRDAAAAGTALLSLLCAFPASSVQAQATVQGRVVDREEGAPIAGAAVVLAGRAPVLTDAGGHFRFARVSAGTYSLSVRRIGYSSDVLTLVVLGDRALLIELDRAPVALDTLVVEARRIRLRGDVRDRATSTGLIDVDVRVLPDRQVLTDAIGRFKFDKVPANTPVTVRVLEFGYLPVTVTLTASRDTVLRFDLDPDPVAARMIAEQKARIVARAADHHYLYDGVIDRCALLAYDHGTAWDLVDYVLGFRAGKVQCYILDEKPVSLSGRAAQGPVDLWRRSPLLPRRGRSADKGWRFVFHGEVEYVDILKFGRQN